MAVVIALDKTAESERRWSELVLKLEISTEDVLTATARRGVEIEEMVLYLNGHGFPGIVQEWALAYLTLEAKPLLEEALLLTGEVLKVLGDPKDHFGTNDAQDARDRTVALFYDRVNRSSPQHVIRAMVAYIEFGLGNLVTATHEAGFARNEKEVLNFGRELGARTPLATAAMLGTERRKAEVLIPLIYAGRKAVVEVR